MQLPLLVLLLFSAIQAIFSQGNPALPSFINEIIEEIEDKLPDVHPEPELSKFSSTSPLPFINETLISPPLLSNL